MNKDKFLNILYKYNLDKLIDKARWKIENQTLFINFLSPSKTLVGFLETPFPYADNKLGIYFTNQLISLINILNGELDISFAKNKICIKDNSYSISYSLADINLIEQLANVKEPDRLISVIDLTQEKDFIKKFIKANKALSDNNILNITFKNEDNVALAKFTLGDTNDYANKISFDLKNDFLPHVYIDLKFDANMLKNILSNSIDAETITINVWEEGLMKVQVEEGDIKVSYYLTALENI